ncbi:MAG: hypothetical protein ACW98K_00620 [Candidatus Kariarchaeaceae archaeon]|jgi:hypothetical protein
MPIDTLFGVGVVIFSGGHSLLRIGKEHAALEVTRWNPDMKKISLPLNKIYVDEIQKEIPLCCYQTAKLGNRYCMCGRAVPLLSILA